MACQDLTGSEACALVDGKFGKALASSISDSGVDQVAREGKHIVIFHEGWSHYQGYPELSRAADLKRIADACA